MNRQQNKTRKAIFNAFTQLLSEKKYNKITVQDILNLSDIGRSTFYMHFETKDDLLKEICKEVFEHIFSPELKIECNKKFENEKNNPKIVISHILYHLKEHQKNLTAILNCESSYLFISYLKENIDKIIDSYILVEKKIYKVPIEFLKNHISLSFIETIKWWIKDNMIQSPETITNYFLAITLPIITQ